MTDKEVMQMALDALELLSGAKTVEGVFIYADQEIEALRTALAQPEKEWVGLTDEDIAKNIYVEGEFMLPYSFASSIEAKLKEKNNAD